MSKKDVKRFLPADLIKDEGMRNEAYYCSERKRTIGIGFNIHDPTKLIHPDLKPYANNEQTFMSDEVALRILDDVIDIVYAETAAVIGNEAKPYDRSVWDSLTTGQQVSLCNMCYQMGRKRLSGFKKMIACIRAGDWEGAQDEAKDSLWFKQTQESRTTRVIEGLAP